MTDLNPSDASRIRELAQGFLDGKSTPLETAVALAGFEDDAPDRLKAALIDAVAVASETDHIPQGDRRDLWHPDVRAVEDRRHDDAQAWAKPIMIEACKRLLAAL